MSTVNLNYAMSIFKTLKISIICMKYAWIMFIHSYFIIFWPSTVKTHANKQGLCGPTLDYNGWEDSWRADGCWLMADSWWLMVDGWWLIANGWCKSVCVCVCVRASVCVCACMWMLIQFTLWVSLSCPGWVVFMIIAEKRTFWPKKFYHPTWGDPQWAKIKKKFFFDFWHQNDSIHEKKAKNYFWTFWPMDLPGACLGLPMA